jgi:hypothetical protein
MHTSSSCATIRGGNNNPVGMRRITSCPAIFPTSIPPWTVADVVQISAFVPVQKLMSCTMQHTFPLSLVEDSNDAPTVAACMMSPPEPPTCEEEDDDHPCKLVEEAHRRRRRNAQ